MRTLLLSLVVAASALQTPASMQETEPALSDSALDAQTRAVAAALRCPVCQGLSLADTPAPLGQEMRALIRDQLRAGRTPAEVKAYFVSKYNEWILLEPEPHGFNLAVYILPVMLLVGGAVLIFVLTRKWSSKSSGLAAASSAESVKKVP